MTLKKIYNLSESNGVPETIDDGAPTGLLGRLFGGKKQVVGSGPESDGVPLPQWGGDRQMFNPRHNDVNPPGDRVEVDADRTIPNPAQAQPQRINRGGTGAPPQSAGPFVRPPNAAPPRGVPVTGDDEPLPDLPLESSIRSLYGLGVTETPTRRPPGLAELYNINEMPRPAGAYGGAIMAALRWAKERGGTEFNARDMFKVWRQNGGQPNQPDETRAYQSFQTSMRQFVDPNGRGTPEKPLVTVMKGQKGAHGSRAIYSWGAVRPSKTAAARPQPGATAYDDMELGPAGLMGQGQDEPQAEPEVEPRLADEPVTPEEPDQETEPEQEPEAETSPDELDWIPEADPETGVGRAMIALHEDDPEKLQELLAGVMSSKTVMDAASKALAIYGRGTAMSKHGIKVAKSSAANLGLPDPDGIL